MWYTRFHADRHGGSLFRVGGSGGVQIRIHTMLSIGETDSLNNIYFGRVDPGLGTPWVFPIPAFFFVFLRFQAYILYIDHIAWIAQYVSECMHPTNSVFFWVYPRISCFIEFDRNLLFFNFRRFFQKSVQTTNFCVCDVQLMECTIVYIQ